MGGLLICFVGQRFHFFLHNFNQSDRFLWSQQHQQLDRRERGLSSAVFPIKRLVCSVLKQQTLTQPVLCPGTVQKKVERLNVF